MSDYSSTVCKDGDRYRVMYRYTAPDGKKKAAVKEDSSFIKTQRSGKRKNCRAL